MGEAKLTIYTSYFGNLRKVREAGLLPLGIVRYMPKYITGVANFQDLAPTKEIFGSENWEERFRQHLKLLDAKAIVKRLEYIAGIDTLCLLCYEKPPDPCHRHLVADWLRKAGYDVKELNPPPTGPKIIQTELF